MGPQYSNSKPSPRTQSLATSSQSLEIAVDSNLQQIIKAWPQTSRLRSWQSLARIKIRLRLPVSYALIIRSIPQSLAPVPQPNTPEFLSEPLHRAPSDPSGVVGRRRSRRPDILKPGEPTVAGVILRRIPRHLRRLPRDRGYALILDAHSEIVAPHFDERNAV
jgi:hypothetical protein